MTFLKNGRPITTLFSDASVCSNLKTAGYGIWAKSSRGSFYDGGVIDDAFNVDTAELIATVRAVREAYARGILIRGDHVVIKTDSLSTVNFMNGGKKNCPLSLEIRDRMRDLSNKYDLVLDYQHVRGHQSRKEHPRFHVNNECDRIAKKNLKIARERKRRTAA